MSTKNKNNNNYDKVNNPVNANTQPSAMTDPMSLLTPEQRIAMQKFALWIEALQQKFPNVEFTEFDQRTSTISFKIPAEDVFRFYYDAIKKSLPDSKVKMIACNIDDKYSICTDVIYPKQVMGWENYNVTPVILTEEESEGDGVLIKAYHHVITFQEMAKYFETQWLLINKGKPMKFKFTVMKGNDVITLPFLNVTDISSKEESDVNNVWVHIRLRIIYSKMNR